MEKHPLNDLVKKIDPNAVFGSDKNLIKPWYNTHGDCIEFQTMQEAIVAERIDKFLTIYKSAISNNPIGFQLKDVRALVKTSGYDGLEVRAQIQDNKLISVTALLLSAFAQFDPTISRRSGYSSALDSITHPPDTDRLAVALTD